MADGSEKPIEEIRVGDRVMSFDPDNPGHTMPGEVSRLFRNVARTVIDLHGLKVTPGHRFLRGEGGFGTIGRILVEDGTIVMKDRGVVRARTNTTVGSPEDGPLHITYFEPGTGKCRMVTARAGIPCLARTADRRMCSALYMLENVWGSKLLPNGMVRLNGKDAPMHWPEGTPLDHPTMRNFIVVGPDRLPYVPDWVVGLDGEADAEERGIAVGDAGPGVRERVVRAPETGTFRPTVVASNGGAPNRRQRRRAEVMARGR